jgi:protein-tyrosine phosphatase
MGTAQRRTASVRVCFVCLGNICRSPTAEGIFRTLVEETGLGGAIEIDSAGTAAYHVGEIPDPRSRATAEARGVRLASRARRFSASDFARFDYVLAMDADNERALARLAPSEEARAKVLRLRRFDPKSDDLDVPDPYYGGERGFEEVFEICEAACRGLLEHLVAEHELA